MIDQDPWAADQEQAAEWDCAEQASAEAAFSEAFEEWDAEAPLGEAAEAVAEDSAVGGGDTTISPSLWPPIRKPKR
jgi:hypothetical protein